MPLPKPNQSENQTEFMNRCMSDETMKSEYPNDQQRLAVCYIQWRDN